jgi:hypothetical protein
VCIPEKLAFASAALLQQRWLPQLLHTAVTGSAVALLGLLAIIAFAILCLLQPLHI